MQRTENLNIELNNEKERRLINEAYYRSPNTLKKMVRQSRAKILEYNHATFEEIINPKIKARNQLKQQEDSERFLSGQSIKWSEELGTTRIFHGIYFTTSPLLD
jgi:hypothetical protein